MNRKVSHIWGLWGTLLLSACTPHSAARPESSVSSTSSESASSGNASSKKATPEEQSTPTEEQSATQEEQGAKPERMLAPGDVDGTAAPNFEVDRVEYAGTGLGTKIALVAYTTSGVDRKGVERAFEQALQEMIRLERLLSGWRSDSDVGRVNAAPGRLVEVSPETLFVLEQAQWSSSLSGGAFDVTFASLGPLWKFGDAADETPTLPEPEAVARGVARVDYRLIQLEPESLRVKIGKNQQVGLGGIAKGYIVDQMAAVLSRAGLDAYLVQAGGDLYAAGTKPGGEPWEAGVQDPRLPIGNSFAKLNLRDCAFSTAGDYARAFFVDGKRYHHIIDPRTGYPSSASRSVTVWAPSAVVADALDDAIFILGPEKGLALVESQADVGAVIVDGQNRLWVSQRLRGRLKVHHLPTDGP